MKTKTIFAGLLCAGFCLSAMTACTGNKGTSETAQTQGSEATAAEAKVKEKLMHKLTVRADKKITEMTATFLNTSNGTTEDIKMEKSSEDDKNIIYGCTCKYHLWYAFLGAVLLIHKVYHTRNNNSRRNSTDHSTENCCVKNR